MHRLFANVASSEYHRRQNRALAELTGCLAGIELEYRRQHPGGLAHTMKTERLPHWYVARKALLEEAKARLLGASRRGAVLWGMGGSGKTVLARAIALDDEVRDRFQGGILWACLEDGPAVEWLWDWLSLLHLEAGPYESELLLGERVRQHLAARPEPFLVILDGVWRMGDVRNLLVVGEKDRLLIATRNYSVVSRLGMEAETVHVGMMEQEESLALLQARVEEALWDRERADALAELVGDLPLALGIGAAWVARRRARGRRAWSDLLSRLQDRQNVLDVLRLPGAERRQDSLCATLDASYDHLDEAGRQLLSGLAASCPTGRFSVEDAARAAGEGWAAWDLEDALYDLVDRSWLEERTDAGGEPQFCFHRLVRQYVMERSRREGECGG